VWCCFPEQNRTRIQYFNMTSRPFLPDTLRCAEKSLKGPLPLPATTAIESPHHDPARHRHAARHCSPFPTPPKLPTYQPRSQTSPPYLLLHLQQVQDDSKCHTSHASCNSHRDQTDQRPATTTCADLASPGPSPPSNRQAPDTLSSPEV
jgi:hypothetical protein